MAQDDPHPAAVNCWEHMKCGRQPGGPRADESGPCPAAVETSCDGMNGGTNAGRLCWAVTGTLCFDEIQGAFQEKIDDCRDCRFFRRVKCEEGCHFQIFKPGFGETDVAELHKLLNDVVRMMSVCRDIFACLDRRPLLSRITEHARAITRADAAAAYVFDESRESLMLEVHSGSVQRPQRVALDSDSPVALAAATRVLCTGTLRALGADAGPSAIAAMPVGADAETVAILELLKRDGDFSVSDEWFLEEFGLIAGLGIENATHVANLTQLKKFDKAKSRFVAMLMHQITSPLATIATSIQALRQLGDTLSQEDRSAMMNYSLDRINTIQTLSRKLLDLASIRSGSSLGNVQPVNPRDVLSQVLEARAGRAREKGVDLVFQDRGDDSRVHADPDGLRVIFSNLVGNAIKYSGDSGKTVEVGLAAGAGCVRVTVRDHGIGIPPEEKTRVFEEFHRGSNVAASHASGSGLGLSLVKELVARYGGHIGLESELGEGTAVTVEFPALDRDASDKERRAPSEA